MIDVAELLRRHRKKPAAKKRKRAPVSTELSTLTGETVLFRVEDQTIEIPPSIRDLGFEERASVGSPEAQFTRAEYRALLSTDCHNLRARNICSIIEGLLSLEGDFERQRLIFPWPKVRWLLGQLRVAGRRNLRSEEVSEFVTKHEPTVNGLTIMKKQTKGPFNGRDVVGDPYSVPAREDHGPAGK